MADEMSKEDLMKISVEEFSRLKNGCYLQKIKNLKLII